MHSKLFFLAFFCIITVILIAEDKTVELYQFWVKKPAISDIEDQFRMIYTSNSLTGCVYVPGSINSIDITPGTNEVLPYIVPTNAGIIPRHGPIFMTGKTSNIEGFYIRAKGICTK